MREKTRHIEKPENIVSYQKNFSKKRSHPITSDMSTEKREPMKAIVIALQICVIGCLPGCLFQKQEQPVFKKTVAPAALTVEALPSLDLPSIDAVFPPDDVVSVERIDPQFQSNTDLLGGIFAWSDAGSITVCIYKSPAAARSALEYRLNAPLSSYQKGGAAAGIPSPWWYQEDHTSSMLYTDGNSLICVRMVKLPQEKIRSDGVAALQAVAERISG